RQDKQNRNQHRMRKWVVALTSTAKFHAIFPGLRCPPAEPGSGPEKTCLFGNRLLCQTPVDDMHTTSDPAETGKRENIILTSESQYLEGPKSRGSEFLFTLKMASQFIKGFRKLHFVGPCVTVFGSARFKPGHRYYEMAEEVGRAIVKTGFTVMTGGGPGVMEAANKGAFEAGGLSVGCNIRLPHEQDPNPYMHEW